MASVGGWREKKEELDASNQFWSFFFQDVDGGATSKFMAQVLHLLRAHHVDERLTLSADEILL